MGFTDSSGALARRSTGTGWSSRLQAIRLMRNYLNREGRHRSLV